MRENQRKEIRAYGIRVLLSRHPAVRQLKDEYIPSQHGYKHWTSSWLLMDYFKKKGLPPGLRVMEIGCGWGLAGIYCAKKHGALVTGVDIDSDVFPYLNLHAQVNKVAVSALKRSLAGLTEKDLQDVDVLIGSDICFWEKMVAPLKRLIRRAFRAGVKLVVIADPGRSPFEAVGSYFVEKNGAQTLDWTVQKPRRIQGRLLTVGSLQKYGGFHLKQ